MGGGSPAPAPPPPPPDYSSQFAGLRSGQDTIRSDIRAAENTFQDESRDLSREITTGFAGQDDRFDDIDSSLSGISGDIDTGFSTVGNQLTDLGTGIDNSLKAYGDQMTTGFTGVNEAMTTGFGTLGNQVDTRFTELGTGLDTAFNQQNEAMSTGFTGLSDQIYAGDTAILEGQQEGFAGVNENVTNVGANLGNQLTETSENVLAGQANIADLVAQYGGNLDTYYAALAQGQTEAAARQAAMQTGLDQFRSDYDKGTSLAQQQRGRIQDAVMGGNTAIQEQLSATADASAQGISNVAQDVANVNRTVDQNAQTATKDFANVAKMIATGFDDGSQQTAAMKNEFTDRLDTVRTVLATQGDELDAGLRQNYSTLVNSFDQQGALIANSVDANGNQISRAIDAQGNLLLASFNTQGQRIDQASLDINSMMAQMDQFGYVPGSNQQMSMLGGARPAAVYSGLASPYASTR